VARHHDRLAGLAELNPLDDIDARDRIDAGEWLVEQQQLRSWAIAVASFVRWRMPFEKPLTRRCIAPVIPVCASACSAIARHRGHAGEPGHHGDELERGELVPRVSRARCVADPAPHRDIVERARAYTVSVPREGRSSPAIILIIVDLPEPLGPSKPMIAAESPAHVGDAEHGPYHLLQLSATTTFTTSLRCPAVRARDLDDHDRDRDDDVHRARRRLPRAEPGSRREVEIEQVIRDSLHGARDRAPRAGRRTWATTYAMPPKIR
jgi:hypothetical protein